MTRKIINVCVREKEKTWKLEAEILYPFYGEWQSGLQLKWNQGPAHSKGLRRVCASQGNLALKQARTKMGKERNSHCPVCEKVPGFHETHDRMRFCCLPCLCRIERWKLECSVSLILYECFGSQGCSKTYGRPGTSLCLRSVVSTAILHVSMGR